MTTTADATAAASHALVEISKVGTASAAATVVLCRLFADAFGGEFPHLVDEASGVPTAPPRATAAMLVDVSRAISKAVIADVERPSERVAREAALLLAEFDALGGGRYAAMKIARRHAADPLERERIAQRVRALVLRRKKSEGPSFGA